MLSKVTFDRLFLDTAYIVALLNPHDSYHKTAKSLFPQVRIAREIWITESVLTELGNALSCFNRAVVVDFINSCYNTPNIKVVNITTILFQRAVKFYLKRKDKEWGLTDCISIVVMEDAGLLDVLTSDEHFQQAGFKALLLE